MHLIELSETESTLIYEIQYIEESKILTIYFRKYYLESASYEKVELSYFMAFSEAKSFGRFYLQEIKPFFKQVKSPTMENAKKAAPEAVKEKVKPRGINRAKDAKRYIIISINTDKINKALLTHSTAGTYLNVKLHMLPDGEVDRFENLGMVTQEVPNEIFKKEKGLTKEKRTSGEILGNAKEIVWPGNEDYEDPLEASPLGDNIPDDLPF